MKRFLIITWVTLIFLPGYSKDPKYPKGANTFVIENYEVSQFETLKKTLLLNGYIIEQFDAGLMMLQTKPKPLAGSVSAYNVTNTIICYINQNNLFIYSLFNYNYHSLTGEIGSANGRAKYCKRDHAGPNLAFIETEKITQQINQVYKIIIQ